ncbi:four helix bundle protein [Ignavibacteria bacterium 4148-Me]|uniref:four helix bundle protein n=1 Tax=Rosettibacter primus TaxID=3111523 RepID=UPI00336BF508
MNNHKDLIVWQKSIELVTKTYEATNNFPKEELFGLTSQLRRAAISVPSNISEGFARKHNKELIQFLYVSLGSSVEIETQLLIAKNINYLNDEIYISLNEHLSEIKKMLIGLIHKLESNKT